ncbi:MAG: hypothetical protein OQJ81_02715 [Melioribacteraceae bacterium]|nr:hypothetical protein [Melioribacteraceae bacterium]
MKSYLFLIFIFVCSGIVGQNEKTSYNEKLKVFINCDGCDLNFIKEKIPFVNYVRDRTDSDIHILINRMRNGGGGREYTLTFLGQNRFENLNDTLRYNTSESESEDKTRILLNNYLKLGLIKYVSKTSVAEDIVINYSQINKAKNENINDDWNNWVIRTRLRGFLNGEKSTNSLNLWGSFSVNRITQDLKIRFSLNGSYDEENYNYNYETYTSISRHQSFRTEFIFSHNKNWSYGIFNNLYSSIYDNIKFSTSLSPGIEYNFFPYSEATYRQLRVNYIFNLIYNNYDEETIYLENNEILAKERISIALDLIQPWGNIETELDFSHYMHDISLHLIELSTEFRINIISGLTLDLYGRLAYIHDQISLPRTGVNLEEVLLRQKQLETNYEYWARFGFTYSFGSIYNNIVNTRFGN